MFSEHSARPTITCSNVNLISITAVHQLTFNGSVCSPIKYICPGAMLALVTNTAISDAQVRHATLPCAQLLSAEWPRSVCNVHVYI